MRIVINIAVLFTLSAALIQADSLPDSIIHRPPQDIYQKYLEISKKIEHLKLEGALPEEQNSNSLQLNIQIEAMDSLLQNLPVPKIEIGEDHIRIKDIHSKGLHKRFNHTVERREVIKFGEDVTIGRNEWVRGNVVVFGGNATLYGRVTGGVIVINGSIRLKSTSNVEKDIVCLWGNTDVDPGAGIQGETIVFNVGRISSRLLERPFMSAAQFLFRILSMLLLLLMMLLIDSAFPKSISIIQKTLEVHYARNLLIGLLGILLIPVVFILLIATIIGIPVALIIYPALVLTAFLFGMTGCCHIGGVWLSQKFNIKKSNRVLRFGLAVLTLEAPILLFQMLSLPMPGLNVLRIIIMTAIFLLVWIPGLGAVLRTWFGRKFVDPSAAQ